MQNKIHFKTIEDIALQYIINSPNQENNYEETINTVDDPRVSIKGCTTRGGSFYCRANKFLEDSNYIFFRKIPPKLIDDDEFLILNTESEESATTNTIYNSNTVIKLSKTKIPVRNCQELKFTKKLLLPLRYDLVYDNLSDLYLPLITNLEDLNDLRNYLVDTKKKMEYFSTHDSIHKKQANNQDNIINKNLDAFIEEEKCCEIIEFHLILFILHIMFGIKIQYIELITDEDKENIYAEICFVLHKMLENIMLKLLYNENNNKNGNNNKKKQINIIIDTKNSNISYESVCSRYVKDYFQDIKKPQNKIILELNNNLKIIFQRLYNAVEILLLNFVKIKLQTNHIDHPDEIENYFLSLLDYDQSFNQSNDGENFIINQIKQPLEKEFIDQYECFKLLFQYLTNPKIMSNQIVSPNKHETFTSLKFEDKNISNQIKSAHTESEKINNNNISTISEDDSIFYTKLKACFNKYYKNFLILLEKNKAKPPFLPKLDEKKYKYTLVLDLDETLVHYIEEENSAYVQVRPYAEHFLKELSKHFEIVLFTAAEEEYTNIILKELNKDNYINYVLCRKYTELNNGSYIKDLSKLGRDLKRVCIIDNNKDNFSLQPENGLFISSYFGEQNDNELLLLCNDLMKIIEKQPDDIRNIIKEIDTDMQNRYSENMYVLK